MDYINWFAPTVKLLMCQILKEERKKNSKSDRSFFFVGHAFCKITVLIVLSVRRSTMSPWTCYSGQRYRVAA